MAATAAGADSDGATGAPHSQQPHHDADPQEQQSPETLLLCGRVTFRRSLSSKLVFYDVQQSPGGSWWEVVVKAGTYGGGSAQEVKDLRDSLRLGDEVQVTGWRESHAAAHTPSLQAVSVTVAQPWKAHSPDASFIPQPAPRVQHHTPTADQQAAAAPPHQQPAGGPPAAARPAPPAAADTHAAAPPPAAAGPAAAHVTGPQVSVCKFFFNSGRCAKGSACPYLHTLLPVAAGGGGAASRNKWLQEREAERHNRAAENGFVHNSSAAAKRQRARVFAAWLVQRFGTERLSAGAGVLDVAGGRGSLTFELAHVHGVKGTLIEPRPLKLNKAQHRQLQESRRAAVISTHTLQDLQAGRVAPSTVQRVQHQEPRRMRAGAAAVMLQQQQEEEEEAAQAQLQQEQQQQQQQHDGALQPQVQQHTPADLQLRQVQAWFGPDLWDTPGWQQLFGDCSLVTGLHPDQACEPILEYAVLRKLPFAIVPCCVFARLFPHRRLTGSAQQPVVTYEELVQYLLEQREDGQQQVLDFEGANNVVFSMAERL